MLLAKPKISGVKRCDAIGCPKQDDRSAGTVIRIHKRHFDTLDNGGSVHRDLNHSAGIHSQLLDDERRCDGSAINKALTPVWTQHSVMVTVKVGKHVKRRQCMCSILKAIYDNRRIGAG